VESGQLPVFSDLMRKTVSALADEKGDLNIRVFGYAIICEKRSVTAGAPPLADGQRRWNS
jgi:hypothetical protein